MNGSTVYARALRLISLDALSTESQLVLDRAQTLSGAPARDVARLLITLRDLAMINAELLRRVAAKENN